MSSLSPSRRYLLPWRPLSARLTLSHSYSRGAIGREHCRILAQLLRNEGKSPFVLDGGLGKKARAEMLLTIGAASPDDELCVISTGQYLGEGFDCPQLDTLFLAFPVSFQGRIV